jgi:hypothetical protein
LDENSAARASASATSRAAFCHGIMPTFVLPGAPCAANAPLTLGVSTETASATLAKPQSVVSGNITVDRDTSLFRDIWDVVVLGPE